MPGDVVSLDGEEAQRVELRKRLADLKKLRDRAKATQAQKDALFGDPRFIADKFAVLANALVMLLARVDELERAVKKLRAPSVKKKKPRR